MKNLILFLFIVFLSSCKSYEITYDSREKTEQMMSEDMSVSEPFALRIAFENSLRNEYLKVQGADISDTAVWRTYFDGRLDNCSEYSCKIIKVTSLYPPIIIYLNNKKIILENDENHSLTQYRYLFISKEKGKYKLYFSNYPKVVW